MGCGKNQRRTRQDPETGNELLWKRHWSQPEENIVRKDSLPAEVLLGFAKTLQAQRPCQARRRPNKFLCLNLLEMPAQLGNCRSEERESRTEAGVSLSERAGMDAFGSVMEADDPRPTLITETEPDIAVLPREKTEKSIELPFSMAVEEVLAAEEVVFPDKSDLLETEKAHISAIQQVPTDVQSPKGREGVITEASDHE